MHMAQGDWWDDSRYTSDWWYLNTQTPIFSKIITQAPIFTMIVTHTPIFYQDRHTSPHIYQDHHTSPHIYQVYYGNPHFTGKPNGSPANGSAIEEKPEDYGGITGTKRVQTPEKKGKKQKKPKVATARIRVEPKTHFANERTFLQVLQSVSFQLYFSLQKLIHKILAWSVPTEPYACHFVLM